jgi:hypothetical protein
VKDEKQTKKNACWEKIRAGKIASAGKEGITDFSPFQKEN